MITKRPRRKRRDRSLRTLDPAYFLRESGLAITLVKRSTPATQVKIFFSGNIIWNGTDTPTAFECYTSDGFMDGCIHVLASGADWIEVEFNGDVLVGAEWQVVGPMLGISQAIAWPQSGTVTA